MLASCRLKAAAAAVAFACALSPAEADVLRQALTINGLKVDRFTWTDSQGLRRTVSLKREGEGNPGHGGYAVQMTYQYVSAGVTKTVIANAPAGDGFGYFVSHERGRNFTSLPRPSRPPTIRWQIFNVDDSPLGRGFAATSRIIPTTANKGIIQFLVNYPRAGTIAATTRDPTNGSDLPLLSTNPADYRMYNLPVRITWYFQDGVDYPRIRTSVDLSDIPGPDRTSFDLRGPYGKLNFEGLTAAPVKQALWGDRLHFRTTTIPLTRNSTWTWNQPNTGARYFVLTASNLEMGLLEPRKYTASPTGDGYSEGRGFTSATAYPRTGNNCPFQQTQDLPCDYEWPYQGSQYELPYDDNNATTTSKKMAWGSTAYFGTSETRAYDSPSNFKTFNGFPANNTLQYDVCVVLGVTKPGSLTREVALLGGPAYNCADGLR